MNRKERRAKERARLEFITRMQQGKLCKRLVVVQPLPVRLPDEHAHNMVHRWLMQREAKRKVLEVQRRNHV
jgi:hypothetical protein